MSISRFMGMAIMFLMLPAVTNAQQSNKPRKWDQEKAVAKVRKILALEKSSLPWNDIQWVTDIKKAEALAKKQNKPIFVYFYLKKNLGPATDPG